MTRLEGATPRGAGRVRAICASFVLLLLAVPAAAHEVPLVSAVDSVGITVADLDRSVAFYSSVLGFEPVAELTLTGDDYARLEGVAAPRLRVARLRLGDEAIELTQYLSPRGRPVPEDSRSNDRWFQHVAIIVNDMDRAYEWLRQRGVEPVSAGPQRLPDWNPQAGGIRAFYFQDPDRHVLEILQFPPGKGAAKWQIPSARLFLGIDHTAIVVADTEASLRFYRDTLGLRVAGESENWGVEQQRLNNVQQARLRITGLRAVQGPGIELLEYLVPRDGRPLPPDQQANDLAHWQTQVRTGDAQAAAGALRSQHVEFVSAGVVDLARDELGFDAGLLVRDPDGHAVQLVQP